MTFTEPSEKKKELESKFIGFWSGIVGRENFIKFYGGTDEEAQEVYDYYLEEIKKLINTESKKRKSEAQKVTGKIIM